MMRKLILIFFPLFSLGMVTYLYLQTHQKATQGLNYSHIPLAFKDNALQCSHCFMYLVGKKHTAQAIDAAGKTYFFDDPGCLVLWIKDQKIAFETLTLWVYSMDTHQWIDMRKAYFDIKETTPMEHGFAAYSEAKEGFIPFEEMQLSVLRGETMANPKIKKQLLGH